MFTKDRTKEPFHPSQLFDDANGVLIFRGEQMVFVNGEPPKVVPRSKWLVEEPK